MRVDDERVGPLDAVQQRARARRQQGRAAVGAVHVQPQAAGGADLGDAGEIVEGAGVGRSRRRHDGDHLGRVEAGERMLERRSVQAPVRVGRGRRDQSAAHDVGGGGHGRVRRRAGDDDATDVRRLASAARRHERAQIGDGAAAHEGAAGRRGEPGGVRPASAAPRLPPRRPGPPRGGCRRRSSPRRAPCRRAPRRPSASRARRRSSAGGPAGSPWGRSTSRNVASAASVPIPAAPSGGSGPAARSRRQDAPAVGEARERPVEQVARGGGVRGRGLVHAHADAVTARRRSSRPRCRGGPGIP